MTHAPHAPGPAARRRLIAALAALALLLAAQPALAQPEPPVDLRPRWTAGQTSRYQFWNQRVQDTTMSVNNETRSAQTTIESTGEITWVVGRVRADGSAACTMTLDWMTLTATDSEGNEQTADSRKPSGDIPPLHELLRAMAGVELTIEVAPDGSITAAKGVDAIRRGVSNEELAPSELDFMETATDLAAIAAAPAQAEPGDAWDAAFRWSHELGHLEYDTTYTLESLEDIAGIPIAIVRADADMDLDVDRDKLPQNGPPLDIRLTDGSAEAQIIFDLHRHEAVGRHSSETHTIETRITLPQATINRTLRQTIRSQLLRIAEPQ